METREAIQKLGTIQKKMHAYNHAMGMLFLDSVTVAPKGTEEGRGETLGVLSEALYEISTGAEMKELLDFLGKRKEELSELEARQVSELIREKEFISKIPQEEYIEYRKLINKAESVWHKAKATNDFAMFLPYLKQIMDSNRRFALYYDPNKAPYDVLLDQYERGLTIEIADRFFAELREKIVPLIKRIAAAPQIEDSFLTGSFPIEQQRQLSDYLMELMSIDRNHCGIGETEHPFTIDFNKYDVRITTNYKPDNFASSMYSVIHEGGHALYELHTGDELMYTCLGGGVSMGIHESQSRLYENIIGRSRAFITLIHPKLQELFPDQLRGISADKLYRAINRSTPSLIRIEADELTYALHIMVRYEIEKGIMDGSLQVEDLPEVWAKLMKEYLGIDVPDDTRGVLQDSHWSGGNVGYFPSYALGSAYGAQIIARMREDIDVDAAIESGSLKPVVDWLSDRIYRFGSMYDPAVLLEKVCGKPFDPKYFTDYLEKKYSEIYNLK